MRPGDSQIVYFTVSNGSPSTVVLKSFGTLRDSSSIAAVGVPGQILPGKTNVVQLALRPTDIGYLHVRFRSYYPSSSNLRRKCSSSILVLFALAARSQCRLLIPPSTKTSPQLLPTNARKRQGSRKRSSLKANALLGTSITSYCNSDAHVTRTAGLIVKKPLVPAKMPDFIRAYVSHSKWPEIDALFADEFSARTYRSQMGHLLFLEEAQMQIGSLISILLHQSITI